MNNIKLKKSEGETFYIKERGIPKGCKYCLKGSKVVLFLNGICQKPDYCSWYCPISEERKAKNFTFANEIEISSKDELLKEINTIKAKGMSITGGEPLSELNFRKTIEYIKYVKSKKGDKFHVHVYTNGIDFNENKAKMLSAVGLDEIRFHPSKENWFLIEKALNKNIDVGAEVPVIPEKENINNLENFILFLNKIGVDFINLNEFEFCFPNSQNLKDRGFKLKKDSIGSVINSYEAGLDIIRQLGPKVSMKMHFCTTKAKDFYQLKNRYIRRAKNIRLPFEVITEEGLLIFGQIEGEKEKLAEFYKILISERIITEKLITFDGKNIKLPFYVAIQTNFENLLKKYELKGYIVEMIPFRIPKYQQITEKTPIKVFRKEYGFNGS
ncbi:MAG: 4Fe-4S cluster-binding domain-containing protein [Candidatus Hermodarchaeota archaeon]